MNRHNLNNQYKSLYKKWKDYYLEYKKLCPCNHVSFPEPIQKKMVTEYIAPKLKPSKSKSYDFRGYVEVKSVTESSKSVPFKYSQRKCKRIIYFEITDTGIMCYDIDDPYIIKEVQKIIKSAKNKKNKQVNINLSKYTPQIPDEKKHKFV